MYEGGNMIGFVLHINLGFQNILVILCKTIYNEAKRRNHECTH